MRRVFYDQPGNDPPVAVASAVPTSGPAPLNVTFDATGSSDPDPGDTLTYFWNFGDGTPETSTTNLTINHTYTTPGTYTATLRARDNDFAFSAPDTVEIQPGNAPPSATIVSPSAGQTFRVGQTITLTGSATDPQDGALPASALSWSVLLNHNGNHAHPWFGHGQQPDLRRSGARGPGRHRRQLHRDPPDGHGLRRPARHRPAQHAAEQGHADARHQSGRPGVDDQRHAGQRTVHVHLLGSLGDRRAGAGPVGRHGHLDLHLLVGRRRAAHRIITPAAPTTYTATFQPSVATGPADFNTVTPCRLVETSLGGPGLALAAGSTRTFTA